MTTIDNLNNKTGSYENLRYEVIHVLRNHQLQGGGGFGMITLM